MNIERSIRGGLPMVGVPPYNQIHAHSTGNPRSTAQNEHDYFHRKDIATGFYTHVVGNGRVIQVAEVNRGAWDVGGGWNFEQYASVELIESHTTKAEFDRDYKLYIELLVTLAKQAGIPQTLDTGSVAGIKTHYYCTYNQPNNGSDHTDPINYLAKWGISHQQFKNDIANGKPSGTTTAPKPPVNGNVSASKENKGSLDSFKSNGTTVTAGGWHYAIGKREFIILMNATTGKEIKRVEAKPVSRPDVQKAYPSLSGASQSGFNVSFSGIAKGTKVRILARTTNSTNGNSDYIDMYFDKVLTVGGTVTTPPKPKPPVKKRFGYRVDDLQKVNGIWQVRVNHLCPVDFTWNENGIDVQHLDVMDGAGNVSKNQTVTKGCYVSFKPSAVVSCSETFNYKGVQLSKFKLKPDTGSIWLARTSVEKLLYI